MAEAGLAGALRQFMASLQQQEFLPLAQFEQQRSARLQALLQHAQQTSPHFAQRLSAAGLAIADINTPRTLSRLPVLTRRELQLHAAQMHATTLPPGHGATAETQTSGSTGEPVKVRRSELNHLAWMGFTLRDHFWHQRDFSKRLGVIRANVPGPVALPDWGQPVSLISASGPGFALPINQDVRVQMAWLAQHRPDYLLTYPNNLAALLDLAAAGHSGMEQLLAIRSMGETLPTALRARVRDQLNIGVSDCYSSQELGVLAVECPVSGLYHVMDEGYVLEVINAQGAPCAPGESGRVVVTDLLNFAMPLLRYEIGDYAVAGPACPCGRPHQTLQYIVGRERNMLRVGEKRSWPLVGFHLFREVAPVLQYQLRQLSAEQIEVRLVCNAPFTAQHETALTEVIRNALDHPFQLRFALYPDRLPLGPNGKFEEFMCLMD